MQYAFVSPMCRINMRKQNVIPCVQCAAAAAAPATDSIAERGPPPAGDAEHARAPHTPTDGTQSGADAGISPAPLPLHPPSGRVRRGTATTWRPHTAVLSHSQPPPPPPSPGPPPTLQCGWHCAACAQRLAATGARLSVRYAHRLPFAIPLRVGGTGPGHVGFSLPGGGGGFNRAPQNLGGSGKGLN